LRVGNEIVGGDGHTRLPWSLRRMEYFSQSKFPIRLLLAAGQLASIR